MRRAIVLLAALSGSLLLPVLPAAAAETCNGLAATITGTAGNDTIIGTGGRDVIAALAGDDIIVALDGGDTICDGPGNDVVEAGEGDDTMVAEATPDGRDAYAGNSRAPAADFDLVTYAARTTGVDVTLDRTGNDGAAGEGDNVVVRDVIGGSGGDTIDAVAVSNTHLNGGAGNDRLTGDFSLAGGPGNDTFTGTGTGGVQMFGGDGDDTMTGTAGRDFFSGDAGVDTIAAGDGDDTAFGGPGNDPLNGGFGNDTLFGEAGNDTLNGALGNDDLIGGDGDDSFPALVAKDGADTLSGDAGTDTADYANRQFGPNTVLTISLDNVTNDGEPGESDNVQATVENVNGAVGSNVITGSTGANVLRGGNTADTIRGADGISGNDVVIGGFGFDVCTADVGDRKECEA